MLLQPICKVSVAVTSQHKRSPLAPSAPPVHLRRLKRVALAEFDRQPEGVVSVQRGPIRATLRSSHQYDPVVGHTLVYTVFCCAGHPQQDLRHETPYQPTVCGLVGGTAQGAHHSIRGSNFSRQQPSGGSSSQSLSSACMRRIHMAGGPDVRPCSVAMLHCTGKLTARSQPGRVLTSKGKAGQGAGQSSRIVEACKAGAQALGIFYEETPFIGDALEPHRCIPVTGATGLTQSPLACAVPSALRR